MLTELFVDNFAGGGGASTGIEMAIGKSVDIAINHDPHAIEMHRANHPNTKHYCENVWDVDPVKACDGNPVALAWFSPDCTHHSRARGGKPADKHIRGLAWVAVRWALLVRPRVIMLENVPEIQTWCPLDENGKMIKERSGETFNGFISILTTGLPKDHPAFAECIEALKIPFDSQEANRLSAGLGYNIEFRELLSCDYGAPTKRKRFYMIGRSDGEKIVWPNPTHAQRGTIEEATGVLPVWHSVAECIDWSIPTTSIFDRKRPLADATMRRIARGVKKFVLDNPKPFIVEVNHSGDCFRGQSIDDPLHTISSKHGYGIVTPTIMYNNENCVGSSPDEPLQTVTTANRCFLIAPNLIQYHSETQDGEVRGQSVIEPIQVVDTSNRYGLVCSFISKYFGGNYTGAGTDMSQPLGTVTAIDHNAVVNVELTPEKAAALTVTLRNNEDGHPVDEPLPTITSGGMHHAEVLAFLTKYYGNGENVADLRDPAPTVTAKDRLGLVTVYGEDYIITDIHMRMLQPRELFLCQGFPEDYIISPPTKDGKPYPKSEQVARCGNAVTPPVATALVQANLPEYCTERKQKVA